MSYLDNRGLKILWNNMKSLVASHSASVTPVVNSGTKIATIDSIDIYSPLPYTIKQVTLNSSSWVGNQVAVNVEGVSAINDIVVSPSPNDFQVWSRCGVYCSSQSSGLLTFSCTYLPDSNLVAYILVLN